MRIFVVLLVAWVLGACNVQVEGEAREKDPANRADKPNGSSPSDNSTAANKSNSLVSPDPFVQRAIDMVPLYAEAKVDRVVNEATRQIALKEVASGRSYSFKVTENGEFAQNLTCEFGAVLGKVEQSHIYLFLDAEKTAVNREFSCSTTKGAFDVSIEILPSQLSTLPLYTDLADDGNFISESPSVDQTGKRFVFEANINHIHKQIYMRDFEQKRIVLLSTPDGSTPGNGDSMRPYITRDGRYAVFMSEAYNIVPGTKRRSLRQIYYKDLYHLDKPLILVSKTGADDSTALTDSSLSPVVSGDGRVVVFDTSNGGTLQHRTYVRDMTKPESGIQLVNTYDGTEATAARFVMTPKITEDGRYVFFFADDDRSPDWGEQAAIYRKDLQDLNQPPLRVARVDYESDKFGFDITPSGDRVVYTFAESKFDPNSRRYVFATHLYSVDISNDNVISKPQLISVFGPKNSAKSKVFADSYAPRITADGKTVVFEADDVSLNAEGIEIAQYTSQIVAKSLDDLNADLELISTNDGTSAGHFKSGVYLHAISGDGRYVYLPYFGNGYTILRKDRHNLHLTPEFAAAEPRVPQQLEYTGGRVFAKNMELVTETRCLGGFKEPTTGCGIYLKNLARPLSSWKKVVAFTPVSRFARNAVATLSGDGRYLFYFSDSGFMMRMDLNAPDLASIEVAPFDKYTWAVTTDDGSKIAFGGSDAQCGSVNKSCAMFGDLARSDQPLRIINSPTGLGKDVLPIYGNFNKPRFSENGRYFVHASYGAANEPTPTGIFVWDTQKTGQPMRYATVEKQPHLDVYWVGNHGELIVEAGDSSTYKPLLYYLVPGKPAKKFVMESYFPKDFVRFQGLAVDGNRVVISASDPGSYEHTFYETTLGAANPPRRFGPVVSNANNLHIAGDRVYFHDATYSNMSAIPGINPVQVHSLRIE